MLIGLAGAPGSGKSTLGARLYAELLELGVKDLTLVHEYASEYLRQHSSIPTLDKQFSVTAKQVERENDAGRIFKNVIGDSSVFLGPIYAEFSVDKGVYDEVFEGELRDFRDYTSNMIYDLVIFVPMFDTTPDAVYRIHDRTDAQELQERMYKEISTVRPDPYVMAPKDLPLRNEWIKQLAKGLKEQIEKGVMNERIAV